MSDDHDQHPHLQPAPLLIQHRRGMMARLRSSFLTGLVVLVPIIVTGWLIWSITGWMDSKILPLVPADWRPEHYIGLNLRGIGVVLFLIFTTLIGWLAKGLIGRSLIRWAERLVERVPLIRSVYSGVKQIAETIFSQEETRFDHACLVEYPRRGMWGVGFVAGRARGELASVAPAEDPLMAVFVPTTPNPTSGFLLYVRKSEIHFLDMGIEDAAKLIISAGLVYPDPRPASQPNSERKSTESR
ncbi:MAG: DUF502 domain-containing protein [Paracoccus sp. (in: a-proteobacteria)]|uniref:DUF502 domain-containing protein n=1 Tax=Paracoccus sp. TaxID=267 RepID=UPI0026E0FC60|nr:DUF502 domain-containing protein [Paracoccus sp. (in: a-proteobacteria)]MDO5620567.1 DUF502 domain-containing protein [Paracoccus sp. (in: a-proteobacteria)]